MPIDAPTPLPRWLSPVAEVQVVRAYRPAPRFAPGGRRTVLLRVTPGNRVLAPCDGPISFAGHVAGGPRVVTVRCGAWRATVSGLAPSTARDARVSAGASLGRALSPQLGLSARDPRGEYRDPVPLLRRSSAPTPPVVGRAAHRHMTPRPSRPAVRLPRAALTAAPASPSPARSPAVEFRLGLLGIAVGAIGLVVWITGVRVRRRPSTRPVAAHRVAPRR